MTTTLLTFLGRAQKGVNGYHKARYGFGDGYRTELVAFFGWPLQKRLKPDRLVIMGTSGSMWDTLFEGDIDFGGTAEDLRWPLIEATDKRAVTAELLGPLEAPLRDRLGCEVRLVLIPYCRDEREQIELLRIMAKHVAHHDTVHIDISHGFRHLPMIALLAALYLRVTCEADIDGIWYGAFDPDTGEAPVHNLMGLLHIADWLQALHTYDKDGDYGAFVPLLGPAGELLARGAFFERSSNPVKAQEALTGWSSRKDRFPPNDPAAELFREELEQRVSWYRRPGRPSWEKELAIRYLKHGDYVRAAIYGLEAVISAEVDHSGGNVNNFDERENIRKDLQSGTEVFRALNHLRNALAHTVQSWDGSLESTLADEASLHKKLQNSLTELFALRRHRGV